MDLGNLNLEQKIGQLFLVAVNGQSVESGTREHFSKYPFGNFILFARNLKDYKRVRCFIDDLQSIAKQVSGIPAFISLDQEGGMVHRVRSGATHFPASMAIAASNISHVCEMGRIKGLELRRLGFNINHAPVVDVNNNPKNPVIGIRSYSDDPATVAKIAVQYIKGLQSSKVIANAKHFPGHGDTNLDSHLALPVIEHTMDRLNAIELLPFKEAIASGVDAIMAAHIIFKALDEKFPATLSHKVITELLRKELKFDGLVLTDCLSMDAVRRHYTMEKGCVLAINAGVDLLCLCTDYDVQISCYDAVLEAVKNGEILIAKIDAAVERILKYKKKYACGEAEPEPMESYPVHEQLADEISKKSITLVKGGDLLPLSGKTFFAISPIPEPSSVADDEVENLDSFAKSICPHHAEISINPSEWEINEIVSKIEGYEIIVYAVYNAIQNPGQVELYKALKDAGKQIVLVLLRAPYDLTQMRDADVQVVAYEYTRRSVENTIAALFGKAEFLGMLPIKSF